MRRMFRWCVRPTRTGGGKQVFAFGARVGYWPCLGAPFVQIALAWWIVEVWYGLPSLKQVEAGDA